MTVRPTVESDEAQRERLMRENGNRRALRRARELGLWRLLVEGER